MLPQLFSGARGQISFSVTGSDGQPQKQILAFVTDVSVSVQDGLQPTYVIGEIAPKSIEPLSIDVSCRVGRIIPVNASTSSAALDKQNSLDYSFEFQINQILEKDTVEIEILDKVTGKIMAVVRNARCSGRSTAVSSGDVARESYNFVGIYDGGYGSDSNGVADINYGLDT